MKKENIEFLKELQKELTTQDTVGQASPRFWVVRTKELIWNKDTEEDYDVVGYYGDEGIYEIRRKQDILDLEEDIENMLIDGGYQHTVVSEIRNNIKLLKNSIIEKENILIFDDEILKDIFSDLYYLSEDTEWDDTIYYGHYEWKIAPDTMFLTLKDAQEHCKNNYYHYIDGYPYAMTAERSPKVEKLLEILETENFDNIKEG